MTIRVGITGGIGSGKSTVCKIFKLLGIPVFEADIVAKNLQNTHPKIKHGLIHLFGEGIYTEDGVVDRKKLGSIIFKNDFQVHIKFRQLTQSNIFQNQVVQTTMFL